MLAGKICGMIAAADQVISLGDQPLRFGVCTLRGVAMRALMGNARRSPVAGCVEVASGLTGPASKHTRHGQVRLTSK